MEPHSIYTAGYEDREIDEFIERLKKHNIQVLIDVRAVPASRKVGFSKNKLRQRLEFEKIKYIHIAELGSPKELRNALASSSDYDTFFKKYTDYLLTKIELLENLYHDVIVKEISCLMCMERLPFRCHRKIVADKIKEIDGNGLQVFNI